MKNLKFLSLCLSMVFVFSSFTTTETLPLKLNSEVIIHNNSECTLTITVNNGDPFQLGSTSSKKVEFPKLVNGAEVCIFPLGNCSGSVTANFRQYYTLSSPKETDLPVDPCNITEEIEFSAGTQTCESVTCLSEIGS